MPSGIVADGIGLMSFGMVYCCNRSPAGEVVTGCDMRLLSAACNFAARFHGLGWLARSKMSVTLLGVPAGGAGGATGGVVPRSFSHRSSGRTYLPFTHGISTHLFPCRQTLV